MEEILFLTEGLEINKEYLVTFYSSTGSLIERLMIYTGIKKDDEGVFISIGGMNLIPKKIKSIKEKPVKEKEYISTGKYKKCFKCGGTGLFPSGNGECWRCDKGRIEIFQKNPNYNK